MYANGLLVNLSPGSMMRLIITVELRIILQNISRRVLNSVLINIPIPKFPKVVSALMISPKVSGCFWLYIWVEHEHACSFNIFHMCSVSSSSCVFKLGKKAGVLEYCRIRN